MGVSRLLGHPRFIFVPVFQINNNANLKKGIKS